MSCHKKKKDSTNFGQPTRCHVMSSSYGISTRRSSMPEMGTDNKCSQCFVTAWMHVAEILDCLRCNQFDTGYPASGYATCTRAALRCTRPVLHLASVMSEVLSHQVGKLPAHFRFTVNRNIDTFAEKYTCTNLHAYVIVLLRPQLQKPLFNSCLYRCLLRSVYCGQTLIVLTSHSRSRMSAMTVTVRAVVVPKH